MRRTPIVLAALVVAALALPAGAEECIVGETKPLYTAQLDRGTYYVHLDAPTSGPECAATVCVVAQVWVESNGVPGLQRPADTCDGRVPPDSRMAG